YVRQHVTVGADGGDVVGIAAVVAVGVQKFAQHVFGPLTAEYFLFVFLLHDVLLLKPEARSQKPEADTMIASARPATQPAIRSCGTLNPKPHAPTAHPGFQTWSAGGARGAVRNYQYRQYFHSLRLRPSLPACVL